MSDNPYQSPSIVPSVAETDTNIRNDKLILASLWHRFAGSVIDGLAMVIVMLPLSFLLMLPGFESIVPIADSPAFDLWLTIVVFLVSARLCS